MSRSYPQQGVGGMDSRYLRADGSIPLSAGWNALAGIRVTYLNASSGGYIALGNDVNYLRFIRNDNEIAELLGVSNNQANLHLKNLRIADLAGVGNRNVTADVNGDLSAP